MACERRNNRVNGRRVFWLASVWVLALGTLSACAPAAPAARTQNLLIAQIDEFSGPFSVYGPPGANGAQMAIDEINAAGGIKALSGAQLELKKFDTQSQPDQGPPQATKALGDKPVAVIGGSQGATVLAAMNVTHQKGIPWLTTAVASSQITDRGYRDVFMAGDGASIAQSGLGMLQKAAPALGIPNATVAFVYSQGTFGVSTFESWKALQANPFKMVADVAYPPTTTDFSAVAARVAAIDADMILAGCYPSDCIALGRLWRSTVQPKKAKLVWMAGATDVPTLKELQELANGLILGGTPTPDWAGVPPTYKKFYSDYVSKFASNPQGAALSGYINIKFIAKALEQNKSTDPVKLVDTLHTISLNHEEGNVYPAPDLLKWQERGTYEVYPSFYVQVQNAVAVPIFPEALKQGEVQAYQ